LDVAKNPLNLIRVMPAKGQEFCSQHSPYRASPVIRAAPARRSSRPGAQAIAYSITRMIPDQIIRKIKQVHP
jgi:hypothetical protein